MPRSFVGRAGELAALLDLAQLVGRRTGPAVALVHGDPGSGKSRLLAEACSRIALDEQVLLAGYEPEARVPLAMARGLLRRLAEVPGPGAAVEALLFDPAAQARPIDPVRLFEAAYRAVAALGPVLIAVDDVQWVDEVSLGLLHYVIRAAEMASLPLVTVAASRPSPAFRSLAGSLGRVITDPDRFVQVRLGPLGPEAGIHLAMELSPALDAVHAAEVWRRAEGSPFWLHQLAAHGHPSADAAALVAGRVEKIGPDAAALLMTLALAGRPLTPEEAADLQRWPLARVEAAGADLVAGELAVDAAGLLRVAHDLIRESVAASIPPELARRLHRCLAAWLEELAGDDEPLLLEALEHRHSGATPALDLALRLARSPRRRLSGTDGLRRLASITDLADPSDPTARELQQHVAALAADLGEHELALVRWSSLASGPGSRVETARAALAASESARHLGRPREAWQWLARARETGAGDVALRIEFDAQESALLRYLEHRAEEECLELGQRLEEFSPARAYNVVVPHLIALSRGEWRSAVEALQAAGEQEAEPHYRLHAHLERASALARLDPRGAGPEVAAGVADALADAERAGCRRCLTETTVRGAEALARIGRPDEAERLLGRSQAIDPGVRGYVAWSRSRALASMELCGTPPPAAAALEALAAEAERQGLLLEAVWVRLDLGALLAPIDPRQAGQVLRAAGAEAERMGAGTELRLAERGLRALGVRTWRRGRRAGGADPLAELSEREHEIARRVASGASNPEIAAALFLSRKTVERHVSNILAKLGIRNRTELAGALAATLDRRPGPKLEGPPR